MSDQLRATIAGVAATGRPGQFDYRQYLARKRIFSLMDAKSARLVAEGQGGALWSGLLALRDRARRSLPS